MASTANRVIKKRNTSYLYIKMGITMFISFVYHSIDIKILSGF